MRVLVACEESQTVTKAFRALGHEAYSCDLQECSGGHPEWHIQGDAREAMYLQDWDLVIAHPPCTRLANSGVRWLVSKVPRKGYIWSELHGIYISDDGAIWGDLHQACGFFMEFVKYGEAGNAICIENPIQHKYARRSIPPATQIIQPYQFGHLETKATCLWLFNLPNLIPTNDVYEAMMNLDYKERAKIHYASPGPDRAKIRSKTFTGIAEALATQWSEYILKQKAA